MYLNCYSDYLHSCEEDGKTSLGSYDTWNLCWDDINAVLNDWENEGEINPGPNSDEAYNDYNSNDDNGSTNCGSNYSGPHYTSYQVEAFCEAAYVYDCSGATEALEATCESLKNWIGSTADCPYCN